MSSNGGFAMEAPSGGASKGLDTAAAPEPAGENPATPAIARDRASEIEYLKWFRIRADFGPATSDVIEFLNEEFMEATGKNLPEGWNFMQDGETSTDK